MTKNYKVLITLCFLAGFIFSGSQAQAQTTCVACTTLATGNCHTSYPWYHWRKWQDCCGAKPLCAQVNFISGYVPGTNGTTIPDTSSFVCGSGCVSGEMTSGFLCGTAEHQTSWYIFEVRPLKVPGAGTRRGDDAGTLRFKIIPCDIPPNAGGTCSQTVTSPACNCNRVSIRTTTNDNGMASIGNTDYDWALYKVNTDQFRTTDAACQAVHSAADGSTVKVSCDYSGTRGPTGCFEPGDQNNQDAGGTRYNAPIRVKVGDRFILAVDNFSTNLTGTQIDFSGFGFTKQFTGPRTLQDSSANVTLPNDPIKFDSLVVAPTCSTGTLHFNLNRPVLSTGVTKDLFSIVVGENDLKNKPRPQITAVIPDPDSISSDSFSRSYIATVYPLYPSHGKTYLLKQVSPVKDICIFQDRRDLDSVKFGVDSMVTPQVYRKTICEDSTVRLRSIISKAYADTTELMTFTWKRWWYDSLAPHKIKYAKINHRDTVHYNTVNGKRDTTFHFYHPGLLGLRADSNHTDSVLIVRPIHVSHDTIIRIRGYVTIKNSGCQDSTDFIFKVHKNPVLITDTSGFWCYGHPVNINITSPYGTMLDANGNTVSRYSYEWRGKKFKDSIYATTANISFVADSTDTLQLHVADLSDTTYCDKYSKWIEVKVSQPMVKKQSFYKDVCSGAKVNLAADSLTKFFKDRPDSAGKLLYKWKQYFRTPSATAPGGYTYSYSDIPFQDIYLTGSKGLGILHISPDSLQDSILVVSAKVTADTNLFFRSYVSIKTPHYCVDSTDYQVRFNPPPVVKSDPANNWCYGDPVTINLQSPDPNGPFTYKWESKNSGIGSIRSTSRNFQFVADSSDSVRVIVTDNHDTTNCTTVTKWIGVTVSKPVVANYLMDTSRWVSASFPATVKFKNSSFIQFAGQGPRAITDSNMRFVWNFGDGSPDTVTYSPLDSVIHTFRYVYNSSNAVTFAVNLRVVDSIAAIVDADRCEPSQSQTLLLHTGFQPNVFTPGNGDNKNDKLAFYGVSQSITLKIYNRWGKEVYSKDGYDNTWDGTELPAGTYYYLMTDNITHQTKSDWVSVIK